MNHPSIRLRLMIGTGVVVATVLVVANFAIYRTTKRTLELEMDHQLLQSASLLAKSAELTPEGIDYEWQEAMKNPGVPEITGIFQFWDLNSGRTTKSPDLAGDDLLMFHGELNHAIFRDITFRQGRRARAIGLLHLPFSDQATSEKAALQGQPLAGSDHPQVLVCVRERESLERRLRRLRGHLAYAAAGTLLAIWGSIYAISVWCLRPIRRFNDNLLLHSEKENPPTLEIPENLPSELTGLAGTFNTTLSRLERARTREKEFALNAAHELRTPLAGILITLEQAIHRPRSADDLTHRIRNAIQLSSGMRAVLDSLMRMARLKGGLEHFTLTVVDPTRLVGELVGSYSERGERRRLHVTTDLSPQTRSLTTDAGLLGTLISNIVDNAVSHSPEGGSVTFQARTAGHDFIFTSRNHSDGLAPEMLDSLFEPFRRGAPPAKDPDKHAGLGLSLAREAARILGGKVDVVIEDNSEIVFTVSIPYQEIPPGAYHED